MDNLNNLLRGWSGRREPEREHIDSLAGKISRSVEGIKPGDEGKREPAAPLRVKLGYALSGALVTAVVFLVFMDARQPGEIDGFAEKPAGLPESALREEPIMRARSMEPARMLAEKQPETGELMEKAASYWEDTASDARVMEELRQVFPEELQWVQKSEKSMRLGISHEQKPEAQLKSFIKINMIIFRRDIGGSWQKFWAADITVRPEDVVEVPLDEKSGGYIKLWGHLLPDGNLVIDSDMYIEIPTRMAASYSGIYQPGNPKQILFLRVDDLEYYIFKTADYFRVEPETGI